MAELRLTDPRDSLKMLRETLCVAQQAVGGRHDHSDRIQRMINDIDRQRPLGPNGKHGDRHTLTCGCELDPDSAMNREHKDPIVEIAALAEELCDLIDNGERGA